ncbi:MAG: GtrA family protein [Oscillospiraceae bacterium]
MKIIGFIKNVFLKKEFIIFVIIGFINTFNCTIIASVFSRFLDPNVSFVIGYVISLTIAYFLNTLITFKNKPALKGYLKFCISYIPNFIIQNVVVFVVFNILGIYEMVAYAVAAVIGIPVTFLLMKFFAFNRKNSLDISQK